MSEGIVDCPVCQYPVTHGQERDYGERLTIDCPRCGRFQITRTALAMASSRKLTPLLSAWIREKQEGGQEPPIINSDNLDSVETAFPNYSVADKLALLLSAIARRSSHPGDPVSLLPSRDYPLCWARNESELAFYIDTLRQRGLVKDGGVGGRTFGQKEENLAVTSEGWGEVESFRRRSPLSDQAFVAMSFSNDMFSVYTSAIVPAIGRAGYRAYRVDAEPHADRIDVKIMSEIQRSRFLVADVTEQRKGVYFEAGYALGLGLPVIWSVRRDDLPNVHFDTRQYNHIVWETPQQFEGLLSDFVATIVGRKSSDRPSV